ncbi:hypothetical protein [Muriicola sp. Z0-33]|uniref:DoxX family protein n=1 Tax=Muriicola sp. Z0-33 TaxID=2816957 RepID=UPI0022387AA2|nr:hypothetical protein [Muriicola sp. Z0-33]MCW5517951.1 hypothetical protein [Muriicola sp. Z0-33]
MAPLILLIASFGITLAINKLLLNRRLHLSFIGRLSLAIMLLFTGIAHFTSAELMIQMLPEFVPFKKETVYLTGIIEITASIGLLTKQRSKLTSIMLVLFFLAILPANIIGSIREVKLGGMENGVNYLYFRIPLQLLFIIWAYYFGIKINKTTPN